MLLQILTDTSRHKKYHIKPFRCLEEACAADDVAFSLEKDLTRHQAQHNGRRFYCPHHDCAYAPRGRANGFTRKDNLRRHVLKQHSYQSSTI